MKAPFFPSYMLLIDGEFKLKNIEKIFIFNDSNLNVILFYGYIIFISNGNIFNNYQKNSLI